MSLDRLTQSIALALAAACHASAADSSNYLQLLNGVDFFYGGPYNPLNPAGTHGVWRCIPSDVLHAPTRVIDPAWAGFTQGQYAAKIASLHFGSWVWPGSNPVWPAIVLSSNDGDCRFAPGGSLNFGMASTATVFGTPPGAGHFMLGPLNGSTPGSANVLGAIFDIKLSGPWTIVPSGAFLLGVDLNLSILGSPSAITVPAGESLTYWLSEGPNQGPGHYQYWVASEDEQNLCSSLSGIASALGTPGGSVAATHPGREFGMFIGTLDAALMVGIAPNPLLADAGLPDTKMGASNPIDTGTGGRTISLTSSGAPPTLSFNSYDTGDDFITSGKLVFANLMAVNGLGVTNCGSWSPGYSALPTGGPGGPALSTAIPQHPRLTGKLDTLSLALATQPAWVVSTLHDVTPGGNEYPLFPGVVAKRGGSTGNNGGSPIPIPNLAALVGVQLYFSALGLDASSFAIAKTAENGHTHSNGYATIFFP